MTATNIFKKKPLYSGTCLLIIPVYPQDFRLAGMPQPGPQFQAKSRRPLAILGRGLSAIALQLRLQEQKDLTKHLSALLVNQYGERWGIRFVESILTALPRAL